MKRTLSILAGIIGILVGLGFIMPALAQLRAYGSMPGSSAGLLVLGLALALGGGGAALYAVRKQGG